MSDNGFAGREALASLQRRYTAMNWPTVGRIRLQSMSAAEMLALREYEEGNNSQDVALKVVQMCWVDSDGCRVVDNLDDVRQLDFDFVRKVADRCIEHCMPENKESAKNLLNEATDSQPT